MRQINKPLLIGIGLFIVLGMFRDFVFVNWNYQLDYVQNNRPFSYAHTYFSFLDSWTGKQVYIGKWVLTGIFTLFCFLIAYVLLPNTYRTWLIKIYALSILVAGALFLSNQIGFSKGYVLSREIMGFLQSPLPFIILYFSKYLSQKKPN